MWLFLHGIRQALAFNKTGPSIGHVSILLHEWSPKNGGGCRAPIAHAWSRHVDMWTRVRVFLYSKNVAQKMSLKKCHSKNVTKKVSLEKCHSKNVTKKMSLEKYHSKNVTQKMSPEKFHSTNFTRKIYSKNFTQKVSLKKCHLVVAMSVHIRPTLFVPFPCDFICVEQYRLLHLIRQARPSATCPSYYTRWALKTGVGAECPSPTRGAVAWTCGRVYAFFWTKKMLLNKFHSNSVT